MGEYLNCLIVNFRIRLVFTYSSWFICRTPILTLPPLETKTIEVALSSPEKAFYAALLTKTQSIFDGFVRTGSATRSFLQIFALLQRLRQACNHPALTVKNRLDSTDMSIKRNLSKPKLDDTPHAMDNSVTHHNNSIEKTEFNSEVSASIFICQ